MGKSKAASAPIPSTTKGKSSGLYAGREYLGPLFLMSSTPVFSILMWHVLYNLGGSFSLLFEQIITKGFFSLLLEIWPSPFNMHTWKIIGTFAGTELLLMRIVPGKEFRATVTPKGNVPIYKANGFQCYLLSIALYLSGAYFGLYKHAIVYDNMGELISSMNVFSLTLCLFLAFKGHYFPSSTDCGRNSNIVLDYYWGTELYPRVFGWDIKQFTNCRFGMMYWAIGIISYAGTQYEYYGYVDDSMIVSIILQLVYISKFFWWETGYFCSMDIQHDRAGYMLCWGCLVWVPGIYASQSYYLVHHPTHLGTNLALLILVCGLLCTYINYDADLQRQQFRKLNGNLMIWGKKPQVVIAKYKTDNGLEKENLLLASGWWSLSRHFHYIPEILAAFFWSVPALFENFSPYFYVMFLTILLVDRSVRDDERCWAKYGKAWDRYCQLVPSKILPGIF